ncbi:MAG: hypothetical protein DIU71_07010 [Proteobacteria bacterium]|nr:MAG: hypothetical protein DIU71_07010 [Pseudomonadota bacterium]
MTRDPIPLIEASIEHLQALSAAFAQDVADSPAPLPPEKRLRKEALMGIRVLLPKLEAARRLSGLTEARLERSMCSTCGD